MSAHRYIPTSGSDGDVQIFFAGAIAVFFMFFLLATCGN